MIEQVVIDLIPFITILFGSTMLFATVLTMLFHTLEKLEKNAAKSQQVGEEVVEFEAKEDKDEKLGEYLWGSYNLVIGEFQDIKDAIKTPAGTLVFVMATIFQIIIMLNLLISVISDTYDKV